MTSAAVGALAVVLYIGLGGWLLGRRRPICAGAVMALNAAVPIGFQAFAFPASETKGEALVSGMLMVPALFTLAFGLASGLVRRRGG